MDTISKSNHTGVRLQKVVDFLKETIPTFNAFLEVLKNNKGWLPLENRYIDLVSKLEPPWCTFYENENTLKILALNEYFSAGVDEKSLNNVLVNSAELLNQFDTDINQLKKQLEQTSNQQDELSADNHHESQQEVLQSIYALAGFFNTLALMIHGRSMCQLVADAKNGDDNAYRIAVHIDRTVLQLPYFQQRLLRSQLSVDQDFLDKLAASIRTPIIKSKIKYRTLRLVFAVLDDTQQLVSLTHNEILNICDDLKITGGAHGINDVSTIKYQLGEYEKLKMSRE